MPLNKFIKYSFSYIFIIPFKKIKTRVKGRNAALGLQTAIAALALSSFLKETASVISEASLHIDTDSGLVHIAACLGTVCAVIFGPTNALYCSYSENINISPRLCGNCWWSFYDWMNACPKGLNAPECMNSIEPNDIIKEIKQKK